MRNDGQQDTGSQCPVCYESGQVLKDICINQHRICEGCLFNLRKRVCPICKKHFRLVRKREGQIQSYGIIFNDEDIVHNGLSAEEDLRMQDQLRRNYQAYIQYRQYWGQQQQQERRNYQFYQQSSYNNPNTYFHIYHSYYPRQHNHGDIHQTVNPQERNYPRNTLNPPKSLQMPLHNQIYPYTTSITNQQLEQDQIVIDQVDQNERRRLERRRRNQEMYNNLIRNQQLVQQTTSQNQTHCNLLQTIGNFFISIGNKLLSDQSQSNQPKQATIIKTNSTPANQTNLTNNYQIINNLSQNPLIYSNQYQYLHPNYSHIHPYPYSPHPHIHHSHNHQHSPYCQYRQQYYLNTYNNHPCPYHHQYHPHLNLNYSNPFNQPNLNLNTHQYIHLTQNYTHISTVHLNPYQRS